MEEDDPGLFSLSPRDFKKEHYNPAQRLLVGGRARPAYDRDAVGPSR